MRNDGVYLAHIAECLERIEEYLGGEGSGADERLFYADSRTQDAVLRRMETLADAAGHLSEEIKARHSEIPWREIGDFRNVLAHGYTEVRLAQVWQTIVDDLPAVRRLIDREHYLSP